MSKKWTAEQVPDQRGRIAVVTGANTGLGFETAKVLAARGATVVLAVRDITKGAQSAALIADAAPGASVRVQRLDLAALESVRAAAEDLRGEYPRIDLLINNAGVMFTPHQLSPEGYELQLATNHLGHFALTGLLIEQMLPVPGSRVVTISSIIHARADIDFDDLQGQRSYSRMRAYGQSKLANLLFAYELQRRLVAASAHTISVAAHPGAASTELTRNLPRAARAATPLLQPFFQRPAMGALASLRAATDPATAGGQYLGPGGFGGVKGHPVPTSSSERSHDEDLQRRLWRVSEQLTGVQFPDTRRVSVPG